MPSFLQSNAIVFFPLCAPRPLFLPPPPTPPHLPSSITRPFSFYPVFVCGIFTPQFSLSFGETFPPPFHYTDKGLPLRVKLQNPPPHFPLSFPSVSSFSLALNPFAVRIARTANYANHICGPRDTWQSCKFHLYPLFLQGSIPLSGALFLQSALRLP